MSANGHENFYQVSFDEAGVHRAAQPPDQPAWSDFLAWENVVRVCVEVEDLTGTDGLYLFSRLRPESYAIPMFAEGALDLLAELVRRGLFDGELAIQAAAAESGLFCWPDPGPS